MRRGERVGVIPGGGGVHGTIVLEVDSVVVCVVAELAFDVCFDIDGFIIVGKVPRRRIDRGLLIEDFC